MLNYNRITELLSKLAQKYSFFFSKNIYFNQILKISLYIANSSL